MCIISRLSLHQTVEGIALLAESLINYHSLDNEGLLVIDKINCKVYLGNPTSETDIIAC